MSWAYTTPNRTWTEDDDACLMDAVAEGATFAAAGALFGISKDAARGRLQRLASAFGWQAA